MTMRPSIIINWVLCSYTRQRPYTRFTNPVPHILPLRQRPCSNVISFGSGSPEPFINVPVACVSGNVCSIYVCLCMRYGILCDACERAAAAEASAGINVFLYSIYADVSSAPQYGGMRVLSAFGSTYEYTCSAYYSLCVCSS